MERRQDILASKSKFPKRLALQELEVPPRPTLILERQEPYGAAVGPYQGSQKNKTFRLTWMLNMDKYHAEIDRYEIFACIQKIKSTSISKWMKIAEIKAQKNNSDVKGRKLIASKRISGFDGGFRYQVVVRGVDILEREGPFSKPVDVILPI